MQSRLRRKWVPQGLLVRFLLSSKELSSILLYISVPCGPLLMLIISAPQFSALFYSQQIGGVLLLSMRQQEVDGNSLCVLRLVCSPWISCQLGDTRIRFPDGTHTCSSAKPLFIPARSCSRDEPAYVLKALCPSQWLLYLTTCGSTTLETRSFSSVRGPFLVCGPFSCI